MSKIAYVGNDCETFLIPRRVVHMITTLSETVDKKEL